MLSALASLELLAMNNMDAAVTGAALTSLQGENKCTAMQTHATATQTSYACLRQTLRHQADHKQVVMTSASKEPH